MSAVRTPISLLVPSLADIMFLCIFLSISLTVTKGADLLVDGDTGYHIRAGEYILKNHSIPTHDIFSSTTPPQEWTAHEWLAEVIMVIAHKFHGLTGVVLFFDFLIAAEFYLLFKIVQSRGGNIHANILIVVLVIGSSQVHWLARPHIFSLMLMTLWYYALDRYQCRKNNYIYILPFIMVLWVNLHGGFIAAFLLTGSYLAGNIVRSLFAEGAKKEEFKGNARAYGLVGVFCLLAALVNPIGVHILAFPFKLTFDSFLMDNVHEFLSPNFHEQVLFKLLLLLSLAILAASKIRMDVTELILLLIFANMALYAARYIPLFGVIAAPILSRHADGIIGQSTGKIVDFLKKRALKIARLDASARGFVWPLAAVFVITVLAANGRIRFGFDEKRMPVAAVEFLKNERINGNMFNTDEFGDYIIYAAWPQYRVFIDGRLDMYGKERIKDYFKLIRIRSDWEDVIRRHDIGWIIYNADAPLTVLLRERPDWKLIYADKVAQIFVRNIPAYQDLINKYPDVRPVPPEPDKAGK